MVFSNPSLSIAKILLGFNNDCFVLSSGVVSPSGDWLGGEDGMELMIKETRRKKREKREEKEEEKREGGMELMIKETIVFSWQPPSPHTYTPLYSTLT